MPVPDLEFANKRKEKKIQTDQPYKVSTDLTTTTTVHRIFKEEKEEEEEEDGDDDDEENTNFILTIIYL
ncbi:hypothetical protein T11_8236 [Trichinella zimbabwensis]|uniref:Uncharacterized protein n=1 Tax=Trichinella zimbabwensis TaxID=268475 RepID=A0A0V1HEP6_9BILA|nr:hypothetical protein T11_8236 [Trichinella zimbabwensis]